MKRFALAVALLGLAAARAHAADPVEGEWLVQEGDAKVKIAPCSSAPGKLCGDVVWLKAPLDEDGQAKHDAHNPDPSLRNRPIVGLPLIHDFHAAAGGRWEGGKIYDPRSGKTYDSKMHVDGDGKLKVAGCISFLCKTQTWTRAR